MANKILLQRKISKVIETLADRTGKTLDQALDMMYSSNVYDKIKHQVGDTHCLSDIYLADDILNEISNRG